MMNFWDICISSNSNSLRRRNASCFFFWLIFFWSYDSSPNTHGHPKTSSSGLWANATPKRRRDGNANSRNFAIYNKAAVKIDIFWIHPTTGELAPSNTNGEGIVFGAMSGVNSYVGHKFEVREIPNPQTKACKYRQCRTAYFTCSEFENQVINIETDASGNFTVTIDDDTAKAAREAKRVLEPCRIDPFIADPKAQLEALADCWRKQTDTKLEAKRDEIVFQTELRKQLGSKLQHYKCDPTWYRVNVTTSPSLLNSTYNNNILPGSGDSNKQVELLFESDYSSVRLYREFLSDSECQALMVGQTITASDSAMKKIRNMISTILLRDPYQKESMKTSIRLRVDRGNSADQECTIRNDGSTTCSDETTSSPNKNQSLMRVTQTEESVDARLFVTCTSGPPVRGGVVLYPKVGVQIVPVSGEAILTIYQDRRGRRDEDPFVDDHVVCPVQKGIVLTLEDTYHYSLPPQTMKKEH